MEHILVGVSSERVKVTEKWCEIWIVRGRLKSESMLQGHCKRVDELKGGKLSKEILFPELLALIVSSMSSSVS